MPTTSKGLHYPASADIVNIAGDIQTLATDIDTVWSAQTYGLTTKGDLLTRTSSALARLPVGADGTVVSALASDPEGVVWAEEPRNNITSFGSYTSVTNAQAVLFTNVPQTHTDLLMTARMASGSVLNVSFYDGAIKSTTSAQSTSVGSGSTMGLSHTGTGTSGGGGGSSNTIYSFPTSGSANTPTAFTMYFPNYTTSTTLERLCYISVAGVNSDYRFEYVVSLDTSALTAIGLSVNNNWTVNSQFALYGLK